MARRRTLGYIQNEWTCPNCGTRNKGGSKTCENCGAPQPENVKFELPSEQKFVTDQEQVQAAQKGADIHCPFCGTRNPADAKTCSQCGGDLVEGAAREAGRVMQAPPPPPKIVKCDNCGTDNPGSNTVCSNCGSPLPKAAAIQAAVPGAMPRSTAGATAAKPKKPNWILIGGILGVVAICCIVIGALSLITRPVEATVTNVYWETNVPVQEIQAVRHTNERGNPPADAYNESCHNESEEVCEQRTVDRGNGYSEVVEECHTETEQYCSYTVDEWTTIQTYTLDGNNLQPVYEDPSIASDQRIGNESITMTVTFSTADGTKNYSPDSIDEFQRYQIGTSWTLKINTFGVVTSVE